MNNLVNLGIGGLRGRRRSLGRLVGVDAHNCQFDDRIKEPTPLYWTLLFI